MKALTAIVLMLGPAATGGAADVSALAVIAHPGVPVDDVALAELRRMFLGDRQFWGGGLRVALLVPPAGTAERALLLRTVYDRTEAQYRHYWIAKVFRAEAAAAPRTLPSLEVAGDLVRALEGAVTVVSAGAVPGGVKVLTVNGLAPGEGGYPLR